MSRVPEPESGSRRQIGDGATTKPVTAGLNGHQHAPLRQERQRLAGFDGSKLSDRELLAVVTGAGLRPRVNGQAPVLADRLLARFGSVGAIVRAHPADLTVVDGVGPAAVAPLAASLELARRAAVEEPPEKVVGDGDIAAVVAPLLHGRTRERVVVVACNRGRRVLGCDVICEGTADRALMSPREAVVAVLRRDGLAFAVAHNHPSGDPAPSQDDVEATRRMQEAADATGLRFLGHVVVTDTSWRPVPRYGVVLPTGQSERVTAEVEKRMRMRQAKAEAEAGRRPGTASGEAGQDRSRGRVGGSS